MQNEIIQSLNQIAEDYQCTILFACESGSRAWGFSSDDSDYDIRFIYIHSYDWYLRVDKRNYTIEKILPSDLDLSGWELRKALSLFAYCNLALYEWLDSPIVYINNCSCMQRLQQLIPVYFNRKKALYHYLRMAERTAEKEIQDKQINSKKVFYILRPLLACEWIHHFQTMPSTSFERLLQNDSLPNKIVEAICKLLSLKKELTERDNFQLSYDVHQWIIQTLETNARRAEEAVPKESIEWKPLNQLMVEMVKKK